jgi:hypothetical protein
MMILGVFWTIIGMLGCIVLLIIGLVSLIRRRPVKRWFLFSVGGFVLSIIGIIVVATNTDSGNKVVVDQEDSPAVMTSSETANKENVHKEKEATEAQLKVEEKAKAEAAAKKEKAKKEKAEKEKQQKLVLEFEKEVFAIEDSAKAVFENYQDHMGALSKGNTDIFSVYSATKEAKEAAESLSYQYQKMDIPDELPDNVQEILRKSSSEMSTAYYIKGKAFNNVLLFFDEQKPKYMDEFKENISSSDQAILSGVLEIIKAKETVGLKIDEKVQ